MSSSEKHISGEEINARPFSRPAEALEVVPGLIVTQHSGDGKANQYFLRGVNLDHGTDFAISVDDMPVNMRTHAHGQGYADLNFLIPELIASANIRKGPYFADEGDFSSVGSVHLGLLDSVQKTMASITAGSFGYRRAFAITSTKFGEGTLLVAGEANTYNGPWENPDDLRKLNGVIRYSQGSATDGFSLTAMAYANRWNSTDQIPSRAISSGESASMAPSIQATAAIPAVIRYRDVGRRPMTPEAPRPIFTSSRVRSISGTISPTISAIQSMAISFISTTTASSAG